MEKLATKKNKLFASGLKCNLEYGAFIAERLLKIF